MRAAVTVSVISVIAVVMLIRAAGAAGFTVLELPLVVMELIFLAAVYILWRALADEEDASESERLPAASRRDVFSSHPHPSQRASSRAVPDHGLRFRLSGWADWWFNGLREPRKR